MPAPPDEGTPRAPATGRERHRTRTIRRALAAACVATFLPAVLTNRSSAGEDAPAPESELADPVLVLAGEAPIDVDLGHAAPLLGDVDGDGRWELLVGQYGDGKLRVYHNTGTPAKPRFESFSWLRAGGAAARIPSG